MTHHVCPPSEFNSRFIDLMRASMAMSFHKYGAIRDAYPHKVNAVASLKQRLKLYEETGNADYLVDVANFAMIEFTNPAHERFHHRPTDGGEGRKWHAGGAANERNNDGERITVTI